MNYIALTKIFPLCVKGDVVELVSDSEILPKDSTDVMLKNKHGKSFIISLSVLNSSFSAEGEELKTLEPEPVPLEPDPIHLPTHKRKRRKR